jgi:hypothetical protein
MNDYDKPGASFHKPFAQFWVLNLGLTKGLGIAHFGNPKSKI